MWEQALAREDGVLPVSRRVRRADDPAEARLRSGQACPTADPDWRGWLGDGGGIAQRARGTAPAVTLPAPYAMALCGNGLAAGRPAAQDQARGAERAGQEGQPEAPLAGGGRGGRWWASRPGGPPVRCRAPASRARAAEGVARAWCRRPCRGRIVGDDRRVGGAGVIDSAVLVDARVGHAPLDRLVEAPDPTSATPSTRVPKPSRTAGMPESEVP